LRANVLFDRLCLLKFADILYNFWMCSCTVIIMIVPNSVHYANVAVLTTNIC